MFTFDVCLAVSVTVLLVSVVIWLGYVMWDEAREKGVSRIIVIGCYIQALSAIGMMFLVIELLGLSWGYIALAATTLSAGFSLTVVKMLLGHFEKLKAYGLPIPTKPQAEPVPASDD